MTDTDADDTPTVRVYTAPPLGRQWRPPEVDEDEAEDDEDDPPPAP